MMHDQNLKTNLKSETPGSGHVYSISYHCLYSLRQEGHQVYVSLKTLAVDSTYLANPLISLRCTPRGSVFLSYLRWPAQMPYHCLNCCFHIYLLLPTVLCCGL